MLSDLGDWHPVLHLQHPTVTVLSQPVSVIYNVVVVRYRRDELNLGAVKDVSEPSQIWWSQRVQHGPETSHDIFCPSHDRDQR